MVNFPSPHTTITPKLHPRKELIRQPTASTAIHSRTTPREQGRWLSAKQWVEEQRREQPEQPSRRNSESIAGTKGDILFAWPMHFGNGLKDGMHVGSCWACRDSGTMCSPLQLAEWGTRITAHPPSNREAPSKPVPTDPLSEQYPSLTPLVKYDFATASASPIAAAPVSVGVRNSSVNSTGTVLPSFGSRDEAASLATVHDRARVVISDKKGVNCFLYEGDGVPPGTRNSSARMQAPDETPLSFAMPKPSLPLQARSLEEIASSTKNGKKARVWAVSDYPVSSTPSIELDNGWTTHWKEPSAIWAPSTMDLALTNNRLDYDWSYLPSADTHPYTSPPDTPRYSFATLGHFQDSNDESITSGSALGLRLAPPADG
ncbi:hypothetical protein FA13DRAFT_1718782 [Coprinellus micaceus]|uniref:Uncharacterized protein n=1 Tax=Coprinellus micaceus TaxID=71717 RepID=A0A4Y7SCJ3_COPMI|nr:hypothetical protein FA13DRAFT_1718782 [Coprinellus micaceus]